MSGGLVFQQALRLCRRLDVPEVARSDLRRILEGNAGGPLQFLYDAAEEAGLERTRGLDRCGALFLLYAAGQLADDLADGDCAYLEEPIRTGPSAQYLLHNLAFTTLLDAGVDAATLRNAALDLAIGAGQQQLEVRTARWTAERSRAVAEGLAGRQFSAYLCLLWAGTRLAAIAADVGYHVGIAAHVAVDLETGDPRFTQLADGDALDLRAWALQSAAAASRYQIDCVAAVVRHVTPLLERAERSA